MSAIRLERTGGLVTARFDKPRGNAIDEPFARELLDLTTSVRGADAPAFALVIDCCSCSSCGCIFNCN